MTVRLASMPPAKRPNRPVRPKTRDGLSEANFTASISGKPTSE